MEERQVDDGDVRIRTALALLEGNEMRSKALVNWSDYNQIASKLNQLSPNAYTDSGHVLPDAAQAIRKFDIKTYNAHVPTAAVVGAAKMAVLMHSMAGFQTLSLPFQCLIPQRTDVSSLRTFGVQ